MAGKYHCFQLISLFDTAQPFGSAESDSPTQALDEAAVEKEDDDYWDVQSDDDMLDMELSDDSMLLASSEFSNIRRIHNENFNESEIRRYDSFLYDGLLSHYRPEYAASPLRNPKTAQVFAHYIHVVCWIYIYTLSTQRLPWCIIDPELTG